MPDRFYKFIFAARVCIVLVRELPYLYSCGIVVLLHQYIAPFQVIGTDAVIICAVYRKILIAWPGAVRHYIIYGKFVPVLFLVMIGIFVDPNTAIRFLFRHFGISDQATMYLR